MARISTGLLTSTALERRLTLRGRLTKPIAACCIARLLVLATEDHRQPIIAYIDSGGGLASETLGILSTMNGIRCPVITFCNGQAAGPALVIAAHGLKGFRVAAPGARFSFKLLAETSRGRKAGGIESTLRLLADTLAEDAQKQPADVLEWFRAGTEFSAQEALEQGLIDAIGTQPLLPESGQTTTEKG